MEISLATGIEGTKEITVTADKTAIAYCSGTLEIFATPSMIALMEQTAMESVASFLRDPYVTVGTEVSVKHFKPTLPGSLVTFRSRLSQVDGMKLIFEVEASDTNGLIGKGIHKRYIVNGKAFIENIRNQ